MTSDPQATPETILVVDDEAINIQIIARILAQQGYTTRSAADGEACLAEARQHRPDLILLDISMPTMDGLTACRTLKADEETSAIPVIFVTAHTGDDLLEAAYGAGAVDYVHKPIQQVELQVRVEAALERVKAARRLAEKETLKAVLETAGGVCHELNQPLQAVMGTVQLQLMDLAPDQPGHAAFVEIDRQLRRMGTITRKLMQITRYRTRPYLDGVDILDIEQSIRTSEEK